MNSTHIDMHNRPAASGSGMLTATQMPFSGSQPALSRFSQSGKFDRLPLDTAFDLVIHHVALTGQAGLPVMSRLMGDAAAVARYLHDSHAGMASDLPDATACLNYDVLKASAATLANARHAMSGFHKQAASRHESAAQSHREAAALFDAAMPTQADEMGSLAFTRSQRAHKSSITAHAEPVPPKSDAGMSGIGEPAP